MAICESIEQALSSASAARGFAVALMGTFEALKSADPAGRAGAIDQAQWVEVMARVVSDLDASAERLEEVVRAKAMPLLRDLDAANERMRGGARKGAGAVLAP